MDYKYLFVTIIFLLSISLNSQIMPSNYGFVGGPERSTSISSALYLDASNSSSYSGSGTTWTSIGSTSFNTTMLNGLTYVENGDFDKALKYFDSELKKEHAFGGFSQTMYLLSAFINKKRGDEKKAKEFFEKQKNEDGKGKSAKRIRGELSMLKNKGFIDELINELSSLGLT